MQTSSFSWILLILLEKLYRKENAYFTTQAWKVVQSSFRCELAKMSKNYFSKPKLDWKIGYLFKYRGLKEKYYAPGQNLKTNVKGQGCSLFFPSLEKLVWFIFTLPPCLRLFSKQNIWEPFVSKNTLV